jgi:hypothetical protein
MGEDIQNNPEVNGVTDIAHQWSVVALSLLTILFVISSIFKYLGDFEKALALLDGVIC